MAKVQLLYVHGGSTYKSRSDFVTTMNTWEIKLEKRIKWYVGYLQKNVPEIQVIVPEFPLKQDAKYEEWKIFFEKHLDVLGNDLILTGSSLGGIFLAKYLSENKVNKNLLSVYLIAPPYDNTLPGEDLVGGFELSDNLDMIMENTANLRLLFSKTDEVVPLYHSEKYMEKLPKAKFIIYGDKNGHFQIEEFPEFIDMIKEDLKKFE